MTKIFKPLPILFILMFIFSAFAENKNDNLRQYIDSLLNDAFAVLNNQSLDEKTKIEKTKVLLSNNLELEWMSRFVLGRNKLSLSQEQINKFVETHKKYIIATYSQAVKQYNGQKVKINQITDTGSNEFLVHTEIITFSDSSKNLKVDYMVRKTDSGFKIFDVITEGISLVRTEQGEFGSILAEEGIDALIQKLNKRI